MPLGLIMLLAVAVLIFAMVLHNAWPEYQIRRLGQYVHVPPAYLKTTDQQRMLDAIGEQLGHHYHSAHHASLKLLIRFEEMAGAMHGERIRNRLSRLRPYDISEHSITELQNILWTLEDHERNPIEHANEADRLAREVDHVLHCFRRYQRLRNRCGTKAPA